MSFVQGTERALMEVPLWASLVGVLIVFIAGVASGWAWGYTARGRHWK